jgi:uncharacterized protein
MPRDRFDPRRLDVQAFAAARASLAGEWPQESFTRLADSLLARPGDTVPPPATWSAMGEQRSGTGREQTWLHLQAGCSVTLQCQRCLQPLALDLAVDRWLRFVEGEDEAARLDEESEDDVLALTRSLDLHALVEDELILALPIVPRHEVCPDPLPTEAQDEPESAPNPFAALAALRRPPT